MAGESPSGGGGSLLSAIGGKIAGGFARYFSNRNNPSFQEAGRLLGAHEVLNKPPLAPVVPQLPTIEQVTQPVTRSQPQRGTPRKGKTKPKRNELWANTLFYFQQAYLDAVAPGGMPGRLPMRPMARPPQWVARAPGAPSTQRGFVNPGGLARARAAAITSEAARNTEMNRRLDMVRDAERRLGRPLTQQEFEAWDSRYSLDQRAEFDPKWGEELEPAVMPGGEQLEPVKVPKREKFSDLYPVEVPQRVKYGQPGAGTTTANKSRAGSGPGTATPSTNRVPATAGGAMPGTGKTGGRTSTTRSTAGSTVLSLDALLSPLLRSLTRRTPSVRRAASTAGATSPGTGTNPGTQPAPDPSLNWGGFYAGSATKTDECRCPRKRSRPRTPRNVCWKGSYIETATGLKKTRREQIPC